MAVGLAFVSFVCAAFLAIFIPVQRVRTSVPRLAITLWLLGYNLIHGINAVVWSGNVDIHVPVWCDIATNFMLGANLALPAAFLCISRQLELLSSMRSIPSHPTVVRNHLMLDIFMCYLLPIFYILLHLVVQDHRFDLVENLGCSASVDPSAVGVSIMWIPPLLLCSITIIFFALSIHNACLHSSDHLTTHLESRSTMNYSSFYRCLVIFMTTTIATGLVYLFCSFSGPALHPWSWTDVHALMSEITIVSSHDEVGSIRVAWWGGLVLSILYLLLSFCLGEETRDIFQWIRQRASRERGFVLPVHISTNAPFSRSKSVPSFKTRPLSFEFKSGWDDMLDVKVPKANKDSRKVSSTTISTRSSPSPTISTVVTEDEAFIASTLSYLGSPTAKTLGLSEPPVLGNVPPEPRMPPPLPPIVLKSTDSLVPTPPPTSPLPSRPALCYTRSCSPKDTFSHPLTPSHLLSRPFEGSTTSSHCEPDGISK